MCDLGSASNMSSNLKRTVRRWLPLVLFAAVFLLAFWTSDAFA
jgi:hypothetical protein